MAFIKMMPNNLIKHHFLRSDAKLYIYLSHLQINDLKYNHLIM